MTSAPPTTEHGLPGFDLSGGRISGFEHNRELRGRKWIEKCDKMLTEPVIIAARNAHRATMLSANWFLEPGIRGDATAERLCDFTARNFGMNDYETGELDEPFEQQLAKLLNYQDNGFRYFEERYAYVNGRVVFRQWADRHPRAHLAWLSPDGGRTFGGVRQGTAGMGTVTLEADRLLLLVRGQQANNWEGVGCLRPCHFDYDLLVHALDMLTVAVERWALPTPVLKYNLREIAAGLDGQVTAEQVLKESNQALNDLIARERGSLTCATGIEYSTFGDGQLNPGAIEAIEQMITRRIFYAYLVQFLSLGVSGVGARNVGDVHQAFFLASLTNDLDYVAGAVSGPARPGAGTIGRLVAYNFGEVEPRLLPRLRHQGLSPEPLMQALSLIPQLKQHNLLTDTDPLEELLLKHLNAGPLTDEAKALRAARHAFQMVTPVAGAAPTTQPLPGGNDANKPGGTDG